MAFTKAPVTDTHNLVSIDPQGSPFIVSDPLGSGEPETLNCLNCFPLAESQWGKNPKLSIHKREPFIRTSAGTGLDTTGTALPRCGVLSPDEASYPSYFFAKGASFYAWDYYGGTLNAIYTPASGTPWMSYGTSAIDSSNARRIVFLDPVGYLYTWLLDGTGDNTTNLTALSLVASKGLVFLNSYLFAVDTSGYKIHNSTVGGVLTTWATTDFISAEQYSDPVMWLDKHKNHLVAFGTKSIEFFYDGGVEVGSPLVRQESYSRQIGLFYDEPLYPGKATAHIDDDIYFLAVKENDSINLCRIHNFQVEEIEGAYAQGVMNYMGGGLTAPPVRGIETININNNPMILINIYNQSYDLVYFPKENTWWMMQHSTPLLYDFPQEEYRLGQQFYSTQAGLPYFLNCTTINGSVVYYNKPDRTHTTTMSSVVYLPIFDLGTNYYKHIARVDAVGDFGDNTLTLYYNPAPNYQNSYVTCAPTRAVTTVTSDRNASWYNVGGYRRMSFKIQMDGYSHAVLDRLDVEYNVGAA